LNVINEYKDMLIVPW